MKYKLGVRKLKEKMIVANWKMNKNIEETRKFAEALGTQVLKSENKIVVCPPFTSLYILKTYADTFGFDVGAQNCFWETCGAFTGEVSPSMLFDMGVKYVILGHSERRNYFGETNEIVSKKVSLAIKSGLKVILCIGEDAAARENGSARDFVLGQLGDCLCGITASEFGSVSVAYEPIWSIGTGKAMKPEQAEEMCFAIREMIGEKYGAEVAAEAKILYGGSVTPENCGSFFEMEDVDGGLIGGASLDAGKFAKMINS